MNKEKKILRQTLSNRIVHWVTALSIFALIISGLGQLPLYKRYFVTSLPGAEWLGNYFSTLVMHYIGAIGLLFIIFYHIVLHVIRKEFDIWPKKGDLKQSFLIIKAMITKGKEPESDKYLAEQRLAYLFIGISTMLLVVTGIVKMVKNISGVTVPYEVIFWAAHIHNFATIFLIMGIIGHLAAFIFKENRALLPGMFTGYVKEEYVKHRHALWYNKINPQLKQNQAVKEKGN